MANLTFFLITFNLPISELCSEAAQCLPRGCSEPANLQKLKLKKTKDIISLQQKKQQNRTKCFEVYFERKVGHLAQGSGIKLHEDLKVQPFGLFSDVEGW